MEITVQKEAPIDPPPSSFTLILTPAEFKKLARASYSTWAGADGMTQAVLDVYENNFGGKPDRENNTLLAGHLRRAVD